MRIPLKPVFSRHEGDGVQIIDDITGGFDFAHLKSVHKFLFEDIYNWSGQIRTVDIAKGNIFCLV